jgi:uncharacterized protein (UPF0335 family)
LFLHFLKDDLPMADDMSETAPQALTEAARERLRQLIARIELLEEQKAGIASDIKDVYGEAKAVGYDTKALRQVIRIRKIDKADRAEQEAILDLYLLALGEI